MSDLTYPYLVEFHRLALTHLSPGTQEWVESKARSAAGGKAYPANNPLPEDHVEEGVGDPQTYTKIYNACVRLLGKQLADSVARQVVGVQTSQPEDLAVTEADLTDLTIDQAALFAWGMGHVQEIYGGGMGKEPPDYVPKAKRRKWIAVFNAVLKSSGDEGKAFAIANSKYGPSA